MKILKSVYFTIHHPTMFSLKVYIVFYENSGGLFQNMKYV